MKKKTNKVTKTKTERVRDFMLEEFKSSKFLILTETLSPLNGKPMTSIFHDGHPWRSDLDFLGMVEFTRKHIIDSALATRTQLKD